MLDTTRAAGDRRGRLGFEHSSDARRARDVRASPLRDRVAYPLVLARCARRRRSTVADFGSLPSYSARPISGRALRDVFIRPALNLPADEVDAGAGSSRSGQRCSATTNADLVLPVRPLGDARRRGRARTRTAGARRCAPASASSRSTSSTCRRGRRRDARRASARLLGEPGPSVRGFPDRQRASVVRPSASEDTPGGISRRTHWIFDRGALTDHRPARQGSTSRLSRRRARAARRARQGARRRRIAGQLTGRLGGAELLWSRVSREPYATIALRPGVAPRRRDRARRRRSCGT